MKIFLVCNSLGGGGAERVHVNLANGFAQRGHEVYLVTDIYRKVAYPVEEKVHVLPLCPDNNNKLPFVCCELTSNIIVRMLL